MKKLLLGITLLLVAPGLALAHAGGVDAKGGHTDRKTGEYHVHKKKEGAQAGGDTAETAGKPKKERKPRASNRKDDGGESGNLAENAGRPKKERKPRASKKKAGDEGDVELVGAESAGDAE